MKAPEKKRQGEPIYPGDFNKLQQYAKALQNSTAAVGGSASMVVGADGVKVSARQKRRGLQLGISFAAANVGAGDIGSWNVVELAGQRLTSLDKFRNSPVLTMQTPTSDTPTAWGVSGGGAVLGTNDIGTVYTSGVVPCWMTRAAGVTENYARPSSGDAHLVAAFSGAAIIWEDDVADKTDLHECLVALGGMVSEHPIPRPVISSHWNVGSFGSGSPVDWIHAGVVQKISGMGGATAALIPMPCKGHVIGIGVAWKELAPVHTAGAMDFRPYNATTLSATSAPEALDLATDTEKYKDVSDGLVINKNDLVRLQVRGAIASQTIIGDANVWFVLRPGELLGV